MKKGVLIAGLLVVFAILGWQAVKSRPAGRVPDPGNLPPVPLQPAIQTAAPAQQPVTQQPVQAENAKPAAAAPIAKNPEIPPSGPKKQIQQTDVSTALSKLKTLEDILQSKNDNDPRLDTDFNGLSPEAKKLLREKYRDIPAESRNDLGTIVYLLGKNLRSAEDWAFIRSVAAGPACLSLIDCSKEIPSSGHEPGIQITLAYPALVALNQAENALSQARENKPNVDAFAVREAMSVINAAKNSKSNVISAKAAQLERIFSGN